MFLNEVPKSLESICSLITDGSHFSPEPQTEGFPIVNAKDIPHGRINLETCTRIKREDWALLVKQNCAPVPGDVLLSKDGTIGRVVLYETDLGVVVLSSVAIIRPKASIDPGLLAYILRSEEFSRQLRILESGSALRRIVLKDIRRLEFSFPSLKPEQKKIAEVLSTVDKAIEQTEALIAKQQRIKTGLMQDLLTKGIDEQGNIRSEATHEFKDSPLGRIPVEWMPSSLGQLAEFLSGYAFKNQELSEHGWRVVRISNLHKADFPYWHYDGKVKPSWVIRDGDIIFSWAGVASSIDCVRYSGPDSLMNQHIYNFKFSSENTKAYVYYFLQAYLPILRTEIEGGAGQLHLTKAKIQSIPIPELEDDELERTVAIFENLEESLGVYNKQLAKIKSLKTGLMQDLLTGKRRVTKLLKQQAVA